jgi:hypothetical protein
MKLFKLQYFIVFIMSFSLLMNKDAQAQVNVQDSTISTFILHVAYAYQFPGGDMTDRYGNNSTIGTAFSYKTDQNWLWTAEINFIFSSNVKNAGDIISEITTDDGFIIGLDGLYANIRPLERGFTLFGKIGKVIPAFHINPNSGLLFDFGAGYIQHKIRWDVENNSAPQLGGDYKKGYDRFTEGFALSQSAGLFFMGNQRLWNFKLSAEVVESFTKSKRYNFDTFGGEAGSRLDLFYGIKVSWMIPLYGRPPKAMYFY